MPETNTLANSLSSVLRYLIAKNKINMSTLARETGVLQPVIHRMATGLTTDPRIDNLLPIAKYFHVSVEQLIGELSLSTEDFLVHPTGNHYIPLLTWDEVSDFPSVKDNTPHIQICAKIGKASFAIVLNDSGMSPEFPKGIQLIVDSTLKPRNEDFVIVAIDSRELPLFKQVLFDGSDIYLRSLHPDFKTIALTQKDKPRFFGVVVQSVRTLRQPDSKLDKKNLP